MAYFSLRCLGGLPQLPVQVSAHTAAEKRPGLEQHPMLSPRCLILISSSSVGCVGISFLSHLLLPLGLSQDRDWVSFVIDPPALSISLSSRCSQRVC